MFYTTNLDTKDISVLAEYLYPNLTQNSDNNTISYPLPFPYRLVFSSINLEDYDNYFSNCFITPDVSLYSQTKKDETGPLLERVTLHKHDFFELMFVLSGEVYVNIENERHIYTAGSCCILNKNVIHTEEYNTSFRIVFLQLSAELMNVINQELKLKLFNIEKINSGSAISEFINNNLTNDMDAHKAYVDFIPNGNSEEIAKHLHDYFDQITRESLDPKVGSTITVLTLIKKLFLYLSLPDKFSTIPVQIGSSAEYSLFSEIVRAMDQTNGRISRSQLSEKLNYSGSYLNEICKKFSGLSLFDYGMTFCMKTAADMLIHSNENITDIGYALGFSNRTHFYKIFKDIYGETPAQYRRNHN